MTLPNFGFLTAGDIRFGRGAAQDAAGAVLGYGRNVLLVVGGNADRSTWLRTALGQAGAGVTLFSCRSEPDVALIEQGVAAARAAKAQVVVALGGGAVIDAGKAIAALVPATRPLVDHLEVVGQGLPLDHAPLPFVALPTTAGTGAEVTKNAVIGVPTAGRKVSLRDNRMLADLAIIDPALTDDAPCLVTLASGLDAITQVIEPYICRKANPLTDALCRDAIPRGLVALKALMQGETPNARDEMAWVSLCGGLALANAGLGAVHGLAGPIGGLTGAPHGAVCGRLLPFVLQRNAQGATGELATRLAEIRGWIAQAFECAPDEATQALADWSARSGLPGLAEMGVHSGDYATLAEAALAASSMKGNPVELSQADLIAVLEQAA
ncbi:iron-containing alcohol dehydrogenase [Roseovarius gahaiensis]|uniref:Iron-containing alcohol dehydrogenase n=1 Tax=Roseovarius gahaiensis TaxID=2716691 RepID=A0A967EKW9_9RHOB|nr:iron-containing alcohol dehydrogenase [Roseovarius gahaiensis]NHQ75199.1 iron-containing alcohol dehydrogenase [Roseovarius gahaiensis]